MRLLSTIGHSLLPLDCPLVSWLCTSSPDGGAFEYGYFRLCTIEQAKHHYYQFRNSTICERNRCLNVANGTLVPHYLNSI